MDQESRGLDVQRPDASITRGWKATVLYLVFGVAHCVVMIVHCNYRAERGNPSDLPCVSWLWTPIDVVGWPLYASADVVTGYAVLIPSLLVRAVGAAFLGGFIATLAQLFRASHRSRQ